MLGLLMAECYQWVRSQLCWAIWFSTCREIRTRGRTCNQEVRLESQMISKIAVFIPWCIFFFFFFCKKPTAGSSHTSSPFKGKRSLRVPNFGSWDFKTCCPQHQNLPWTGFIAGNNSRRADSPLNCSSNSLSGATCLVSLIFVQSSTK